MPKKSKRNIFINWFYGKGIFQNPIAKTYRKNNWNILSNSAFRIIASIFVFVFVFVSFYFLMLNIGKTNNIISQLLNVIFFVALIYFPSKYFYVSINQILAEFSVNFSVSNLKWSVYFIKKRQGNKSYRSLQSKMNRLRTNLLDLLEYSEILSPPISNYELNRLRKRIDIFFNCASEILVPIKKSFSKWNDYDNYLVKMAYESKEHTREEQLDEMFDEASRRDTGEINCFDMDAMDEFLNYFWNVMFEREEKRYSAFSFKHPVNIIMLSSFFYSWNSVLSSCPNSKETYDKASEDIEEYYKSIGELESERRQRTWRLRADVTLVLISVGLSTLIQYLISIK